MHTWMTAVHGWWWWQQLEVMRMRGFGGRLYGRVSTWLGVATGSSCEGLACAFTYVCT